MAQADDSPKEQSDLVRTAMDKLSSAELLALHAHFLGKQEANLRQSSALNKKNIKKKKTKKDSEPC